MARDVEVLVDFAAGLKRVGTLFRQPRRGGEAVSFEYHPDWLSDGARFSLEPALRLGRGTFSPSAGAAVFGSIGDSAPDTWGRRLMQRAERRLAAREKRAVRTLTEMDYLLGVTDTSRLGALRFRIGEDGEFLAPRASGVPKLVEIARLLAASERILRDEETEDDLQTILAPGSSLGGARPKASVIDRQGRLSIAKFPNEIDAYGVETWEFIALTLASRAGIRTPVHELVRVGGKKVLLSRRFDREGETRIPFLSAMSMLGLRDGERASYPELVDALTEHGSRARDDARELYRRMVFNVLVSNVDDHLRNHGFCWMGNAGWALSPAFDLNPTPVDVRSRILTTSISLDDATCDLELVLSVASYFALGSADAKTIIKQVASATATWREVAKAAGVASGEARRMESAFEHADLHRAVAL